MRLDRLERAKIGEEGSSSLLEVVQGLVDKWDFLVEMRTMYAYIFPVLALISCLPPLCVFQFLAAPQA
jgi:hypothetical protein